MGGAFHWTHLLFIAIVVLVLFGGKGKISAIMGDAAKGIRAFQKGLKGEEDHGSDNRTGALPRTDAEKEDLRR
jgi:sec-independent protein translocase protein TatA